MAKVAFLLAPDFEDSEMKNPYEELQKAGHETIIIGNEKGVECTGKKKTVTYVTEVASFEVNAAELDAIVIPGGSAPEELRVNPNTVQLVKRLHERSKVIAGICHGPQVMISADILKGKESTSYIGIRDDVINSGATYLDEEVVVSGNIITSRTPKDEPAFIREILNKLP